MLRSTSHLKIVSEQFRMSDYNSISTYMDICFSNTIILTSSNSQALLGTIFWYLLAVQSLIYAMTNTQPGIAFRLFIVSRYCNNVDSMYFAAITQILQYIKGIFDDSIIFWGDQDTDLNLIGYTNADYTSANKDQESSSELLFSLREKLISWNAKRQMVVVLSTCEAEYIAFNKVCKKVIWL